MPRVHLAFDAAACDDPLAAISTELPDEAFTILSSHPTDDGILGLVELDTGEPDTVVQQFTDAPELSHEVLYKDGQTVLIQYVVPEIESGTSCIGNPAAISRPVAGWLAAEHTASHERVSQFTGEMEAAGIRIEYTQ